MAPINPQLIAAGALRALRACIDWCHARARAAGEAMKDDLCLVDRMLFWTAAKSGLSIDWLYSCCVFRAARMMARVSSAIFDRSPR